MRRAVLERKPTDLLRRLQRANLVRRYHSFNLNQPSPIHIAAFAAFAGVNRSFIPAEPDYDLNIPHQSDPSEVLVTTLVGEAKPCQIRPCRKVCADGYNIIQKMPKKKRQA